MKYSFWEEAVGSVDVGLLLLPFLLFSTLLWYAAMNGSTQTSHLKKGLWMNQPVDLGFFSVENANLAIYIKIIVTVFIFFFNIVSLNKFLLIKLDYKRSSKQSHTG